MKRCFPEEVTTQCPGTLLLAHADVTLIVDKDAFEAEKKKKNRPCRKAGRF